MINASRPRRCAPASSRAPTPTAGGARVHDGGHRRTGGHGHADAGLRDTARAPIHRLRRSAAGHSGRCARSGRAASRRSATAGCACATRSARIRAACRRLGRRRKRRRGLDARAHREAGAAPTETLCRQPRTRGERRIGARTQADAHGCRDGTHRDHRPHCRRWCAQQRGTAARGRRVGIASATRSARAGRARQLGGLCHSGHAGGAIARGCDGRQRGDRRAGGQRRVGQCSSGSRTHAGAGAGARKTARRRRARSRADRGIALEARASGEQRQVRAMARCRHGAAGRTRAVAVAAHAPAAARATGGVVGSYQGRGGRQGAAEPAHVASDDAAAADGATAAGQARGHCHGEIAAGAAEARPSAIRCSRRSRSHATSRSRN